MLRHRSGSSFRVFPAQIITFLPNKKRGERLSGNIRDIRIRAYERANPSKSLHYLFKTKDLIYCLIISIGSLINMNDKIISLRKLMTKFLCTKCSGFYNLDCTLETNSPYGVPDRCPFGVLKCTITWEIIEDTPPETLPTPEPQPAGASQSSANGIGTPIAVNDRKSFAFLGRNSCPDA